jgi:DNA-binding beta-propeller fold protein YncE
MLGNEVFPMRTRIAHVLGVLAASGALVTGLAAATAAPAATAPSPPKPVQHHVMAYVTMSNVFGGTAGVTPVDTVTGRTLKQIAAGANPSAVAVAPNQKLAYVANPVSPQCSVTVISTRTGTVVKTIPVPGGYGMTTQIGVTPNGRTVYVSFGPAITAIRTADGKILKQITGPGEVVAMFFTPDGRKLYTTDWDGQVWSISTATNTAHKLPVTGSIALSPHGRTLYVAGGNTLVPVSTATEKAGKPIRFPEEIGRVIVSKDGRTGYVSNVGVYGGPGNLYRVNLVTGKVSAPVKLPGVATGMLLTPNGKRLYIMEQLVNTVTAIRAATGTVLSEIKISLPSPVGFAVTPDGRVVYVLNNGPSLTPISTATNRAGADIPLPGWPDGGIAFFRR